MHTCMHMPPTSHPERFHSIPIKANKTESTAQGYGRIIATCTNGGPGHDQQKIKRVRERPKKKETEVENNKTTTTTSRKGFVHKAKLSYKKLKASIVHSLFQSSTSVINAYTLITRKHREDFPPRPPARHPFFFL